MTDTFTLDVQQAAELKFAFARNGWTNADIKEICGGNLLEEVLRFVKERKKGVQVAPDMAVIPLAELTRLQVVEEKFNRLYIDFGAEPGFKSLGDLSLSEVFTEERCEALGWKGTKGIRGRILNLTYVTMRLRWEHPIRTLGDLVKCEEEDIIELGHFGDKAMYLIKAVLKSMGLALGMKIPGEKREGGVAETWRRVEGDNFQET